MATEITDALIRGIRPPAAGRVEIWDSLVNGLVLRVTTKGSASWSVRARTREGRQTRPGLGTWPRVSVRQARQQARALLGDLATGADPVAERRAAEAAREARAGLPIVGTLLELWQAAKAGRWSPRYAREVERLCERIIVPALGDRVLVETTRTEWTSLIAAERAQRPTTATWLYQISSSFLNHAEAVGWIDRALLPRKGLSVLAPKASPRQRALSDDELVRVWNASRTLSARAGCFVRLLVMCGCRVSEGAGLQLDELDLAVRRWTIPAERAKNRSSITLPLPVELVAELVALMPDATPSPHHHVLGTVPGAPLQAISRIKRNLDTACGVSNWTMHDIRRTVRTGLARLGIGTEIAEAALKVRRIRSSRAAHASTFGSVEPCAAVLIQTTSCPLSTHDSRDEATQEAERLYGQPLAWAPLDAHIWTAVLDMDSAYVVTDL
ncbi:MAG TPA: integrase family protein [Acetobacteraceae bacterium]|nr:integrase family protein [Acetobacteraceae bacterium]